MDSWRAEGAIRGRWRRAQAEGSVARRRFAGCKSAASGRPSARSTGAAQQMAGSMPIVQDDSHQGMGPWLQCIVLDESITAQLHHTQPTLSAEACTRLSLRASGQASAPRDKRAQDGSCS